MYNEEIKHYMRLKREAEDELEAILDSMPKIKGLIRDVEIYRDYVHKLKGYNK